MTIRRCGLSVVGVITLTVVSVSGQQPARTAAEPSAAALCQLVREADKLEAQFLQDPAASSDVALEGEELWRLVTSPGTPYRQRLLAATRGKAIGPQQLRKFWTAVAAFTHIPTGVYPSPCAFNSSTSQPGRSPADWHKRATMAASAMAWKAERRVILDLDVDLPMSAVDYPVTMFDRERAPWLWQMSHVLPMLMDGVKERYKSPSDYRALKDVAFAWKAPDSYEASVRNGALRAGPRNADWVGALVELALGNHSAPYKDVDRYALQDLYVWGEDSYHLEELVHVGQIVILQQTQDEHVAADAADHAVRLATAKYSSFSDVLKPLRSATAILAISRWATDSRIPASLRYLSFAGAICQMVPDPPFELNRALSNTRRELVDQSSEVASALAAFEAWLQARRPQFEQQALVERWHWNQVAAEIGRTVK